jgi:hypothetical protein
MYHTRSESRDPLILEVAVCYELADLCLFVVWGLAQHLFRVPWVCHVEMLTVLNCYRVLQMDLGKSANTCE